MIQDYTYSDPTVITVLQASPYYDAFGYLDKCETSYTFETSFIVGQTTSNSSSFSIGASMEAESPVLKSSIRTGYTGAWDESFTSQFETTYSTTLFYFGAILGADGKDGVDGKNGKDGLNGKDGTNGKDGANGKDGNDGKDGLGVADIKIDENGNFIFTMSDGSTINAGSVPKDDSVQTMAGVSEGVTQEDIETVKTLATVATMPSSISFLWNVINLFALIGKTKKSLVS